jgi:hypothetical protein
MDELIIHITQYGQVAYPSNSIWMSFLPISLNMDKLPTHLTQYG